jgi:hypothetical protein
VGRERNEQPSFQRQAVARRGQICSTREAVGVVMAC